MGPEAAFGDRVVGLELHAHVVTLRGDDFRRLRATELAVQPGVRGQAAAHLHEVVYLHTCKGEPWGATRFPQVPPQTLAHGRAAFLRAAPCQVGSRALSGPVGGSSRLLLGSLQPKVQTGGTPDELSSCRALPGPQLAALTIP